MAAAGFVFETATSRTVAGSRDAASAARAMRSRTLARPSAMAGTRVEDHHVGVGFQRAAFEVAEHLGGLEPVVVEERLELLREEDAMREWRDDLVAEAHRAELNLPHAVVVEDLFVRHPAE